MGKGRINKTSDGGLTWSPIGNYSASTNFVNLEVYEASATHARLIAVGDEGQVRNCLLYDTGGASVLPIGNWEEDNLPNLTCSWAKIIDGKLHVFLGTNKGKVLYSEDAVPGNSEWSTFTTLPVNVTIERMIFRHMNTVTRRFIGLVLGDNTELRKFELPQTLNPVISTITTPNGIIGYVGMAPSSNFNTDYSVSVLGIKPISGSSDFHLTIRYLNISTTTITAGAHHYTNQEFLPWWEDITSVCRKGTVIYLTGPNGQIVQRTDNGNWLDKSQTFVPLPLSDVHFFTTVDDEDIELDQAMAAGQNGSLFYFDFNNDDTPSFLNGSWRMLNTGFHDDISAIDFFENELVVARQGRKVTSGVIDTVDFNFALNTTLELQGSGEIHDIAASDEAGILFAGDNGLLQFISNMESTPAQLNTTPEDHFYGAAVLAYDSSRFITSGYNTEMRFVSGTNSLNIQEKYPTAVDAFHFTDINTGHVVLDGHNLRKTDNGGNDWQIVNPSYPVSNVQANDIYTHPSGNAIMVGDNGFTAKTEGETADLVALGIGAGINLQDLEFHPDVSSQGFIAGNNYVRKINFDGATTPILGTMPNGTVSLPNKNWKSMHAFVNGNMMVVGQNAAFLYKGGQWAENATPGGLTNADFRDVYFRDDYNGYIVGTHLAPEAPGDASVPQGLLMRTTNVTITPVGPADIAWMHLELKDSINISHAKYVELNHIDMPTKYDGVFSGIYTNAANFENETLYPYTRHFHDESEVYSTHFYYDKLGRLVLSQNTKQHNLQSQAGYEEYAYTIYDQLGRIQETGIVADTGWAFLDIFGGDVSGAFNANVIDEFRFLTFVNEGVKKEISRTYYDEPYQFTAVPSTFIITQSNLRNRVASRTYTDDPAIPLSPTESYDNAVHYSYDIHGNVEHMYTEVGEWGDLDEHMRFKTLEYDYDLVSGNVKEVLYQKDLRDQFIHRYDYDAENRIKTVATSVDGIIWDQDAKYFYYDHGPLARVELGQNQVQGQDYAYTLQGWLKGINSNTLDPNRDMGHDGKNDGNPNGSFARDVYGLSLAYFVNDYKPIDQANHWNAITSRFEASMTGSDLKGDRYNLYNGNIGSMVNTITNPADMSAVSIGNAYVYDQLHRINQSRSYDNLEASTNTWGTGSTTDMYENTFTYDANGNILRQMRKDSSGGYIDSLTYKYQMGEYGLKRNRLYQVRDSVLTNDFEDDIDDMGAPEYNPTTINSANNYSYDELGQLIRDEQEGIGAIDWRNDGKIRAILRAGSSAERDLTFTYDPSGNRLAKKVYSPSGTLLYSNYTDGISVIVQ